jgi:parallel beta-helix repeat protein
MRGLVGVAAVLALSTHAAAATFTVDSTLDTDDKSADGLCRDANNKCTLRAAVTEANRNAGADVINFGITGSGTKTITLVSAPPGSAPTALAIIYPLTIDGTSQNGYADGAPVIEIDGSAMGSNAFIVSTPSCELRGVRIKQFALNALSIIDGGACVVRANQFNNNFIGIAVRAGAAAAGSTVIGGPVASDRNVFSANTNAIEVANGARGVQIVGNFIGTDATGAAGAGNSAYGIYVDYGSMEVRANVISANTYGVGVYATNGPIVVADNLIGTNAAGTVALPNQVAVSVSGAQTQILGNTIAGSTSEGIRLSGSQCVGTVIRGNWIGTTMSGVPVGNSKGIWIDGNATASTIGGTQASERNVISGNTWGVQISSSQTVFDPATQTHDHTIVGNYIGILPDGTSRPNQVGVRIDNAANNHVEDNMISSNDSAGVAVVGLFARDNSIRRNSIFANGALAIDLENDGVTPNDSFDADTGANNRQNYPVLVVGSDDTTTRIGGNLLAPPLATFEIDFFTSPTACTSGSSDAKQYLGTTMVTADGNGDAKFLVPFPRIADGMSITATATSVSGATSELSGCATAAACTPLEVIMPMDATIGASYFAFLQTTAPAGIQDVEVIGGALPTGLVLLGDGELSGIPEAAGSFTFTLRLTDTLGCASTQTLSMRVCPLIEIQPDGMGPFPPGAPVEVQLTASGGTPPYQFIVENGPDPLPGLHLSESGLITGTPTVVRTYEFIVDAVDQTACTGARPYAVNVGCLPIVVIPPNELPIADLGAPYRLQLTANSGVAPYRFLASGLPAGFEFSQEGLLAGTPRARGTSTITITVTDAINCQRQVSYTLVVDVSNPPGCECGSGGGPSSRPLVGFALVVTLRRRRRARATA